MSVATRRVRYTLEEYLQLEAYANVRHEFLDGEILAMAGGTPEHGATAMRVAAALVTQLRGRPCTVYSSDVRIRVAATGLDTYPDLSVVCGPEQRDVDDRNALVNPIVLVEVLSPSTEDYDRGEKLEHYKQIPSLREVVLISSGAVEIWRHQPDGWRADTVRDGTAHLESLDCDLVLSDLFPAS